MKATLTRDERRQQDQMFAAAERGSHLRLTENGPHRLESIFRWKGKKQELVRHELRSRKHEYRCEIERGRRMSGRQWVRFRKATKRAERAAARANEGVDQ